MTTVDSGTASPIARPDSSSPEPSANDGVSWVELVVTLLRWRRLVIFAPLVTGLLVVAVTLSAAKKYTTALSFTPVASMPGGLSAGALASLAGQFGVSLPTADPSSSPEFYAYLMRSEGIGRALVENNYKYVEDGEERSGTLIDLYEIDQGTAGKTLFQAIHILGTKILTVSFDARTSIVTAEVKTKWPEVSLQMAQRLLQLVDSFNLRSRQTIAGLEGQFLVGRLDTARAELRAAENAQQSFLVRNRSYDRDPALVFEFGRLQRELTTRQEVFSVLTQSYEQARLAAVHNTPTVSLVVRPALALRFDKRNTLPKLIGGLVAGFLLALAYILLVDAAGKARTTSPTTFAQLTQLYRDSLADLRRLKPPFRRAKSAT